jgi:hypothetical protein
MNSGNVPATKFAQNVGKKDEAIHCSSDLGPRFCDIGVDDCHATTGGFTSLLGCSYANSTPMSRETFLTGSGHFNGGKIEVFEITSQIALSMEFRSMPREKVSLVAHRIADRHGVARSHESCVSS